MSGEYIVIIQNKYMRTFRKAGATDRSRAKPLADLGIRARGIFRRMVDKGVFVDAGGGLYYMNEDAAHEFVVLRRKRALYALVLTLIAALFIWIFGGKLFR